MQSKNKLHDRHLIKPAAFARTAFILFRVFPRHLKELEGAEEI